MSSPGNDIDISALWGAIGRRRGWLIGLPLIVGILTYTGLNFVAPQYTSEARLLIDSEETVYTRPTVGERLLEPKSVDEAIVASQVQVLTSADLAKKVISRLKLRARAEFNPALSGGGLKEKLFGLIGLSSTLDARTAQDKVDRNFVKKLLVYPVPESHVININFSSEDKDLAAEVANVLADEYVVWQREAKLRVNQEASQWLSTEIKKLREKVKGSEARVEEFRAKSGQQSGSNNVTLNDQQLSELNSQMIVAKAQRSAVEARAKLVKDMVANKKSINAAPDVLKSPLIQRLQEQQASIQRTRAELSATMLAGHPRIKQLNSELAGLRWQIAQEVNKIADALYNEVEIAKAKEASLIQSLDAMKNRTANSSGDTVKLRALQREAKANRDLLESYLARFRDASARRDSDSVPANATIISKAYPSLEPSFPKIIPMTALATAAMFFIVLSYLVTSELLVGSRDSAAAAGRQMTTLSEPHEPPFGQPAYSDRTVIDEEFAITLRQQVQSEPSESAPVQLQAIEQVASANVSPQPMPGAQGPQLCPTIEAIAETFRQLSDAIPGYRVIFAGMSDEVDTNSAVVALARNMANGGARVVIVDASEGAKSVSGSLGIARAPGLQELVKGEVNFEDVILRDPESSVRVISSGNPRRGDAEQNLTEILNRILDGLDNNYDIVFLHGQHSTARDIFRAMDADFDAGVVVTARGEAEKLIKHDRDNFLGFTVKGLEIVYYAPGSSEASAA